MSKKRSKLSELISILFSCSVRHKRLSKKFQKIKNIEPYFIDKEHFEINSQHANHNNGLNLNNDKAYSLSSRSYDYGFEFDNEIIRNHFNNEENLISYSFNTINNPITFASIFGNFDSDCGGITCSHLTNICSNQNIEKLIDKNFKQCECNFDDIIYI